MNWHQGITKGQFVTWIITIVLFIGSVTVTSYVNTNNRIRALELSVHALQIRYDQHEKSISEIKKDTKSIHDLLIEVDKKVTINSERIK